MILVDKPRDWTSHDVVAVLRRQFPRGTKVGHTGTLDPLATGLLAVLVGACTRLQGRLQGFDKVYSGTIRLGVKTDTGDVTGKISAEKPVPPLTLERLGAELAALVGTIDTPAPAYSAVKHKGKALYEYARAGLEVPVKPRSAKVYSVDRPRMGLARTDAPRVLRERDLRALDRRGSRRPRRLRRDSLELAARENRPLRHRRRAAARRGALACSSGAGAAPARVAAASRPRS